MEIEENNNFVIMPPNVAQSEEIDVKLTDNFEDEKHSGLGDSDRDRNEMFSTNCGSPFSRSSMKKEAQALASAAGLRCRNVANHLNHAETRMRKMIINAGHEIDNVCHFSHLPQWLQDNDYLHFGHRRPMPCVKACIKSIFQLHTETMNIWTHGIGCLFFIGFFIYYFFYSSYAVLPFLDKMIIGVFFFTAIACLAFSTIYHTLSCHSYQVCFFYCKLDYCGISMLITGSIIPLLYFGFYCSVSTQILYMIITIVLCLAAVTVSLSDKFSDHQYRHVRALVFYSFGIFGAVPLLHWYYVHLDSLVNMTESLYKAFKFLGLMGILYTLGAIFYLLRIPERFYPGKFDLLFHSHQLFHVFVFAAAVAHLQSISCMVDFRFFEQAQDGVCLTTN